MSPIASVPALLEALRQHRLLETNQLDELLRKLANKSLDVRTVAQRLIEQGWLTAYQVNQLLQGRGQQLLLGSYILLERLGEGGMGEVFKARNWKLGKLVALKLIRKERLASATALKRFQREARLAAQLSHPNIVAGLDADQVGATHIFVMEYVEGVDLAKLVKDKGPLTIARACEYIRQAACGLTHAHAKGMVHRDIKPHNLLLARSGPQGTVKILDMGLARMAAEDDSSTLTQEGAVMGTLDYISPEQAMNSHTVDIRADLYSLGCTFYYLLTGQVPFPGGTAMEKLSNHAWHEPQPVEQLRPDVPPGVASVVRRLLAKKPEQRFQTPAELAQVLAKGPLDGNGNGNRPRRRRLLWPLAGSLALLLLLSLVGLAVVLSQPPQTGPTTPSTAAATPIPTIAVPPTSAASKTAKITAYQEAFRSPTPATGWRYLWNEKGPIGKPDNYVPLRWDGRSMYTTDGQRGLPRPAPGTYLHLWQEGGHPGRGSTRTFPAIDYYAIVAYTIQPADGAGSYRISNSRIKRTLKDPSNGIEVLVHVNGQSPLRKQALGQVVDRVESFDTDLGKLQPGDTIFLAIGPNAEDRSDTFEMDFAITREAG